MVKYSYGNDLLVVESDFELTELKQTEAKQIDYTLRQNTAFKLPKTEETNLYRAGLQANFSSNDGIQYLDWPQAAQFAINLDKTIQYQTIVSAEELSLFFSNEVAGICLWNKGYFLLHAAAVEIGGKAFIFAGIPGAGKSTLVAALCKHGAKVISDDLSIVECTKNAIICHKGLTKSKLWDKSIEGLHLDKKKAIPMFAGHEKYYYDFESTTKPCLSLSSITFISKETVNPSIGLTQYFPLPHQLLTGDALKAHFMMSSKIAKNSHIENIQPFSDFRSLDTWAKNHIQINA